MNNIIILSQSNPDSSLISPHTEVTPQLSYFELITSKLDSWDSKQQLIQEQKKQTTKSFLLQDPDDVNGIVRTYKLTVELVGTNQVDLHKHQLELMEMEGDYVS